MDISNGFIVLIESIHIVFSIVKFIDDLQLSDYEWRIRKKKWENKKNCMPQNCCRKCANCAKSEWCFYRFIYLLFPQFQYNNITRTYLHYPVPTFVITLSNYATFWDSLVRAAYTFLIDICILLLWFVFISSKQIVEIDITWMCIHFVVR